MSKRGTADSKIDLEKRVRALEEIVDFFAMRFLMLARGLHEENERKILGIITVRGNDGVLLGKEKIPKK